MLKNHLKVKLNECEKILDDNEVDERADAKLEVLVEIMDLMNWDL